MNVTHPIDKGGTLSIDVVRWDSATTEALSDLVETHPLLSGKAEFVKASITGEKGNPDILDRRRFIGEFGGKWKIRNDTVEQGLVLVELNQNGEKSTYKKYLVEGLDTCYVFTKDIAGNWSIVNKFKIDRDYVKYLHSIQNDTSNNNSWGNGLNEVCIVSFFRQNAINVYPILSMNNESFERFVNHLK